MSGFLDMVANDVRCAFISTDEFAEMRTVRYNGTVYDNVPMVLNGIKQSERKQLMYDHSAGLYLVTDIVHIAATDLGGHQPEKGQIIGIAEADASSFFRDFYVATSKLAGGMLRLELEAIDE